MKTMQCAHPPHHHDGFVATCRLWKASGGVHALLVLVLLLSPKILQTAIERTSKACNFKLYDIYTKDI